MCFWWWKQSHSIGLFRRKWSNDNWNMHFDMSFKRFSLCGTRMANRMSLWLWTRCRFWMGMAGQVQWKMSRRLQSNLWWRKRYECMDNTIKLFRWALHQWFSRKSAGFKWVFDNWFAKLDCRLLQKYMWRKEFLHTSAIIEIQNFKRVYLKFLFKTLSFLVCRMVIVVTVEMMIQSSYQYQPTNAIIDVPAIKMKFVALLGGFLYINQNKTKTTVLLDS